MISNPTPQRALRGHMPQRPTPRAATTEEHHAQLAGRLTLRDRWLARMLHEHKVFTTQQIVELCYPTMRAANHRLLDLFKWRVVERFQPFVSSGTAPMHYVLDIAGSVALAYEDGLDPKQLGYRHEDAIGIAHSLRLAHTVRVNGFFTSLVALSREPGARGRLIQTLRIGNRNSRPTQVVMMSLPPLEPVRRSNSARAGMALPSGTTLAIGIRRTPCSAARTICSTSARSGLATSTS